MVLPMNEQITKNANPNVNINTGGPTNNFCKNDNPPRKKLQITKKGKKLTVNLHTE